MKSAGFPILPQRDHWLLIYRAHRAFYVSPERWHVAEGLVTRVSLFPLKTVIARWEMKKRIARNSAKISLLVRMQEYQAELYICSGWPWDLLPQSCCLEGEDICEKSSCFLCVCCKICSWPSLRLFLCPNHTNYSFKVNFCFLLTISVTFLIKRGRGQKLCLTWDISSNFYTLWR